MLAITEVIRRLHGGSQARLMRASDGNLYVVKFQGNPQGTGVLANELLTAGLAKQLGLPMPQTEIVYLPPELSRQLSFETPQGNRPVSHGLHFASRVVLSTLQGRMYDTLPKPYGNLLRNADALLGVRVFDLWVCNRDTRQAIYWRLSREKKFSVTFIDNGHCMGGPSWDFSNLWFAHDSVTLLSAEFWIRRIEELPPQSILDQIMSVPREWCASNTRSIEFVYEKLRERQASLRAVVRELEHIRSDQGSKRCSEEQVRQFNSAAGRFAIAPMLPANRA